MKNEFTDLQERYQTGASAIAKILGRRQQNALLRSFTSLEEKQVDKEGSGASTTSKEFAANFLFNTLERKFKERVSTTIKKMGESSGITQPEMDPNALNLKLKGKILMNCIKEYPHLNLKKAFWRWYLCSETGSSLVKDSVDKLVLYTNINKETAAYRLFRLMKDSPSIKVDIKTKRMGLVVFFMTRLVANRRIRSCFDDLKHFVKKGKVDVARRILEVAATKRRIAFNSWRDLNNSKNRIRAIQSGVIKKLLNTKVGQIFNAFLILKTLPERKEIRDPTTANRFEKGLDKFIRNKLKFTFDQFRIDYEEASVFKKRAAILMVKMSESKLKKYYGRWH